MKSKKPKTVLYRRKREQRTDYNKRLKLLMSRKMRLAVRISNQRVIAQLIEFTEKGDKISVGVDSFALKKLSWENSCKNLPAAYLTGLIFGKKALGTGAKEGILDTGLRTPTKKGKIYAFLKGVIDSGFKVPHKNEDIFPEENKLFGKDLKNDISDVVEKVKQKVLQ
jgi:large subunit ribosomal protein L18